MMNRLPAVSGLLLASLELCAVGCAGSSPSGDDVGSLDGVTTDAVDSETDADASSDGSSGDGSTSADEAGETDTSSSSSSSSTSGTGTGGDPIDTLPPSDMPPGGLAVAEVPLFLSLGWDDNSYSGLEGSGGTGGMSWSTQMAAARTNPAGSGQATTYDGAPVTMSYYYTGTYIGVWNAESPTYVKRAWRQAYDQGHEVGNHTFSHSHGGAFAAAEWTTEISDTLDWLTKPFDPDEGEPDDTKGIGAPLDEIYGFRTPFLEYNDATLSAVQELGFVYDCSIEEGWQPDQDGTNYTWPFTLDEGSPGHDVLVEWGLKEPITAHPGLWEMPPHPVIVPPDEACEAYGIPPGLRAKMKGIADWFDEDGGKITGFDYNLWVSFNMTKAEFVATLQYTLDQRLAGNRAPMMFGTHTDYYSSKYTAPMSSTAQERQEAMEEFLDYALSKPEVRVVSNKQILDWVRQPVPLQ